MKELIQAYCRVEFGDHPNETFDALMPALIVILHSHRYQKRESFTEGLDFSVIRDLIYSYSKDARERFMGDPMFAFLFEHFCLEGKEST